MVRTGRFRLPVARAMVDEQLHNKAHNEVVLITYLDPASSDH